MLAPWGKNYDQLRQHNKKHYFAITLPTKVCIVKSMVFPVVMYGCESWTLNAKELMILNCGVKSSRLLRVPWNARRSKQSILKEIIPEYSLEGLLLKPEAPILWPHANNWLIRKDSDLGKDWRQEEKGMTEDEMVGLHHHGHEFEQALGVGDRQGGLACCSPWGRKESDTTEWLNWTKLIRWKWHISSSQLPVTVLLQQPIIEPPFSLHHVTGHAPWFTDKSE